MQNGRPFPQCDPQTPGPARGSMRFRSASPRYRRFCTTRTATVGISTGTGRKTLKKWAEFSAPVQINERAPLVEAVDQRQVERMVGVLQARQRTGVVFGPVADPVRQRLVHRDVQPDVIGDQRIGLRAEDVGVVGQRDGIVDPVEQARGGDGRRARIVDTVLQFGVAGADAAVIFSRYSEAVQYGNQSAGAEPEQETEPEPTPG